MKFSGRSLTSISFLFLSLALLASCGGSINKFDSTDRRTPVIIGPILQAQNHSVGGLNHSQPAYSSSFILNRATYFGPLQPAEAISASYKVYVGGMSAQ